MDTGIEILVEPVDGSSQDDPPHWQRILVVGELKKKAAENNHESAFLGLAQYAREVFRKQDRRFVLGFTLCGSTLRLWQFDRLGSSGSTSFNINKDGHQFIRVMLGYYLMSEEQLGFDPTIHRKDGKHWIEITRDGLPEYLYVEGEVRKYAVIIGRATSCWKVYLGEGDGKRRLVVKDSWQYEERGEEGELIQDATSQSVTNIAYYYYYETVQYSGKDDDVLENVRRGMMKNCGRHKFTERPITQSSASRFGDKTASTKSKSGSRLQKRVLSSSSPSPSPASKRSRTSLLKSPAEPALHNRIYRRVVTCSPGKPLNEASTCSAIVTAFIRAITGHQSLFKAGILHRDISIGNILLNESEDDRFLIDLDLAVKLKDYKPSGAPSRTGTKVFISIGALLGDHYTFMLDLESFFWVFFWICVHYDSLGEDGKMNERRTDYKKWNYDIPESLAVTKTGIISQRMFRLLDKKVTEFCTPLLPYLKELHRVVFPGYTARQDEDENLYEEIIQVFKKAKREIS